MLSLFWSASFWHSSLATRLSSSCMVSSISLSFTAVEFGLVWRRCMSLVDILQWVGQEDRQIDPWGRMFDNQIKLNGLHNWTGKLHWKHSLDVSSVTGGASAPVFVYVVSVCCSPLAAWRTGPPGALWGSGRSAEDLSRRWRWSSCKFKRQVAFLSVAS